MAARRAYLFVLGWACVVGGVQGLYLPGTAKEYKDGALLPIDVNVLQSIDTHLPYEYYSLPFCKPNYPVKKKDQSENLGLILIGDRIRRSPYDQVKMNQPFKCLSACEPILLDGNRKVDMEEKIAEEYTVSLILDGLPVAVKNPETGTYSLGLPIGYKDTQDGKAKFVIYNHLEFEVRYERVTTDQGEEVNRIVAFHARPFSHKHPVTAGGKFEEGAKGQCNSEFDPNDDSFPSLTTEDGYLTFSYSVSFIQSDTAWATRWDVYFNSDSTDIHWFSIVNSLVILLFLTGMVAFIMMRTLKQDILNYNIKASMDEEDLIEETGWKLVHGDVFRAPQRSRLLAVYVGSGVQLLTMSLCVLIFACLGFLSPAHRGSFFTAIILCFVLLANYGGYTTAQMLKMWDKDAKPDWMAIFMTATMVPGQMFITFFLINLAVWSTKSSAAVPFIHILMLVALWLGIFAPLTFAGGVLGFRRPAMSTPCRINMTVREIPPQPWYFDPKYTILMGGVLPFGAVFIEVFFILTSIWMNRYYYVFGILFIVFSILAVTCAEITIVVIYFQLCSENYHWWWRAFFTSASSGGYLFLYTIFYFFSSSLKIRKFVSILLFFGYMALLSYVFAILTGTMGFVATFVFVRKIYGSIKVD